MRPATARHPGRGRGWCRPSSQTKGRAGCLTRPRPSRRLQRRSCRGRCFDVRLRREPRRTLPCSASRAAQRHQHATYPAGCGRCVLKVWTNWALRGPRTSDRRRCRAAQFSGPLLSEPVPSSSLRLRSLPASPVPRAGAVRDHKPKPCLTAIACRLASRGQGGRCAIPFHLLARYDPTC